MISIAFLSPLRLLALVGSAVLIASGAARADTRVVGSGKQQSETRAVSPFQAVTLKGSINLVLRQAAKEAVEVRADDNLLPLIETRVVDHSSGPTLEIRVKNGSSYSSRQPVVVTVDVVRLKSLTLAGSGEAVAEALKTSDLEVQIAGSGNLQLRQLSADNLAVTVAGSGDVSATGRSGKLSVTIAGSGGVQTRELEAQDVSVEIAGSGDAHVHARKTLAVSIAGSGDVDYTGDATTAVSVVGTGSVKKR
ncbi:MAG TPA: head GIN domain-containing protein [Albitalea sp.]|uniref:head GIN domain-containing protein n=1 Tax=Piscinibacter sp. TaxID=1903157 RepID=UPI002ED1B718